MLNSDDLKKLAFFDPAALARLGDSLNTSETVSAAGNINTAVYLTRIAVSGTMAFTLPDGTVVGQRKKILCESAAAIPLATITITTPDTTTGFACSATWIFDTAGQGFEVMWMGAGVGWRATNIWRAGTSGANGVVIGTTVLTGRNLWLEYSLSVTGTVSSTTTKGLPNGSYVGETITINVTTAASIPVGALSGTYRLNGAAKTSMNAIDATTEVVYLEWDGQAWCVMQATLTSTHPTFS